jgi:hypothetical protein
MSANSVWAIWPTRPVGQCGSAWAITGNVGQSNVGQPVTQAPHRAVCPSTERGRADRNVHEPAGPYYWAAIGNITHTVGKLFTLTVQVAPPVSLYDPILVPVPTSFAAPVPAVDPNIHTLILYNSARFNQFYTGAETITSTNLVAKLNTLAAQAEVDGVVINLSDHPELNAAYDIWNSQPGNPMAANYVASSIKQLLYYVFGVSQLAYLVSRRRSYDPRPACA